MATIQTFVLDGSDTVFSTTFGATDRDQIQLKLASGAVIATGYTIDGIGDKSANLTITWPDAVNQTLPENLLIIKFNDVDAGSPSTSMLTDFTSSNIIQPQTLQNEFTQIYAVIAMITAGVDLSTIDLSVVETLDTANLDTRLTAAEADIDAIEAWDTDDLPNASTVSGASTTNALDTLQGQVNNNAASIASGVGLPVAQDDKVLKGDGSTWAVERQTANGVDITDSGGFYSSTEVEGALQEVGNPIRGIASGKTIAANDATQTITGTYSTVVSLTLPETGRYLVFVQTQLKTATASGAFTFVGRLVGPTAMFYGYEREHHFDNTVTAPYFYWTHQEYLIVTDITAATLNFQLKYTGSASSVTAEETTMVAIRIS